MFPFEVNVLLPEIAALVDVTIIFTFITKTASR